MMAWATVSADLLRTGTSTANRVRWSIIEISYLHSIPTGLKWIPIRTLLSQPILFGTAVRQVNGLSGVLVCCVLLFVVDKLDISRTNLARRDSLLAINISVGFCRKSI